MKQNEDVFQQLIDKLIYAALLSEYEARIIFLSRFSYLYITNERKNWCSKESHYLLYLVEYLKPLQHVFPPNGT